MVSKANKTEFTPKNPQKYTGKLPIICRSAWERTVCTTFDEHPYILEWASESVSVPYLHPFTQKMTLYVPDFLVKYADKNGKMHVEIIEVKPAKEALAEHAKTKYDRMSLMINQAKWKSAELWAKKNGIRFRVVTEMNLFRNYGKI